MTSRRLYFTAPGQVELHESVLPPPGPGEVLVETVLSGISQGSEMLVYEGHVPPDLRLDDQIPSLPNQFQYPFPYGYSSVGRVTALGPGVKETWKNRRVFAFQPHSSAYLSSLDLLFPIPDDVADEDAVFFPHAETALNLVMDGAPLVGEHWAVFGLGIIGLLAATLLAGFPLVTVCAFDPRADRRDRLQGLAGIATYDPSDEHLGRDREFDAVLEVSGSPEALNQAIRRTGYGGRILLGSWYGTRTAALDLGGRFHRSRIRLICSQVDHIAPELSGRWTKERRFTLAWETLRRIRPSRWISHRFPLDKAGEAYRKILEHPQDVLQVILTP